MDWCPFKKDPGLSATQGHPQPRNLERPVSLEASLRLQPPNRTRGGEAREADGVTGGSETHRDTESPQPARVRQG